MVLVNALQFAVG